MRKVMLFSLLGAGMLHAQASIEAQCLATGDDPAEGSATIYFQMAASTENNGALRAALAGVFTWVTSPRAINVTGLEFRSGEAVYRPGMAPSTPIRDGEGATAGGGGVTGAPLVVIDAILKNPAAVSVTMLTQDRPQGAFRCQLKKAELNYVAATMAGGYEMLLASVTRDANGAVESAMVQSQISQVRGAAGRGLAAVRGVYPWRTQIASADRVEIDLGSPTDADASVGGYPGGVMRGMNASQRTALTALLANPAAYEVRLASNGEVVERGRVRTMERSIRYLRSSDIQSFVEIDFTRGESGAPDSGVYYMISDLQTNAARAAAQGVRIAEAGGTPLLQIARSGLDSPPGRFGLNGVGFTPDNEYGLGVLDRILSYPDLTALEFQLPSGVARGLYGAAAGAPSMQSIVAATLEARGSFAPGSLITIRGSKLGRLAGSLVSWQGRDLPTSLNGVVVEIAGRRAPLFYVSPDQVNVQVPFETPTGRATVAVHNGSEATSLDVRIEAVAPTLFDIRPAAAGAGEVVDLYGTGFGQTSPALSTGRIVDGDVARRAGSVTATLAGRGADVIEVTAMPGLPGLYRARVRVPAGTGAGMQPVVLRTGDTVSNSVIVPVC